MDGFGHDIQVGGLDGWKMGGRCGATRTGSQMMILANLSTGNAI
jgi:hypothetical protein